MKQQVKIYDRIFRYGVRCLGIYAITNIPSTPFNSATFQRFFFLTLTSAAFDFSVVPPSVLHFSKNFFFIRASRIVELKILFYFLFRIANGTRSKEEKEVLDMFGSIFSLIEIGVFKEIMSNNIEVTNLLKIWLSTFNFDCTA